MEKRDLIAAIATGSGNAAIGIIRLSGPDLARLFPALLNRTPRPRAATLAEVVDAEGNPIDSGLALYFPGPHSYTGEDVLEWQGHGGAAVMNLVLRRCLELGARVAQPGEFSLRAFLSGKMDLAQAEAVADLISARTEKAARSAVRSLKGEFSKEIAAFIGQITRLRVEVEARLDFPEEDVEVGIGEALVREIHLLRQQMRRIEAAASRGSILQEGATVVLYGPPNVGKSSLMNRLAEEDVSIVTDIPGTTRDAIRRAVAVSGVPIVFIDTAGMRASEDPVERLGIERTQSALAEADLALVMFDARDGRDPALEVSQLGGRILYVGNKADLCPSFPRSSEEVVYVSAKTGEGTDRLCHALLSRLGWSDDDGLIYAARARHIHALTEAGAHLDRALEQSGMLELAAEELRCAQRQLREVGGDISSDDLLGEIFSKFCIGK